MAGGPGADRTTLHGMTKLMVSSPAELLSALPFVIGFHPADSLVVVAMHGTQITFALRTDLPGSTTPEEEARAAVLHLATVVLQQHADAVTIIGYGEESRVTPAVLRISDAFRKARVTIVDELRVADGRYWSYLCTDRACCPTEGRLCEPAFSIVATKATYAGAVALPSREALEAQLAPVTGDDREAMTAATAKALLRLAALASHHPPTGGAGASSDPPPASTGQDEAPRPDVALVEQSPPEGSAGLRGDPHFHYRQGSSAGPAAPASSLPGLAELRLDSVLWARLGLAAPKDEEGPAGSGSNLRSNQDRFFASVRSAGRLAVQEAERCYRAGGRLTDDHAAWLGVLLLHVPVRDYAWTRTGTEEWELALWSDLMRRVEPRYRPAPAGLLAFVAFRMGLGPLASIAVERALDQKPNYSFAVLMHRAIMIGLPPSAFDGWPVLDGMPLLDDGIALRAEPETREDAAPESRGDAAPESQEDAAAETREDAAPQSRADADPESRDQPGRQGGERADPAEDELAQPGRPPNLPMRLRSAAPTTDLRAAASSNSPARRSRRPANRRRI